MYVLLQRRSHCTGGTADGPARAHPQASDLASTSRLLIAIIDLYHAAGDAEHVNGYLQILSKKHGQLRQAVQKMVDRAMEIVQESEGKAKLDLIETLRDISEGKVSQQGGRLLRCIVTNGD